jgi:aryl-alcohol dehydrogenase-like predicted oxidoreductase
LLRHVVDSGVTFPGTAGVYGPHSNEQLIREAFHRYPEDLVIATKGGFVRGGYDYSTSWLMCSVALCAFPGFLPDGVSRRPACC